ncbi:g12336 [Coccomyxa viridis]|uniref:G12336 protein n=1 Tax=Coccomyxa viridis TaxID=1274662 RepID=A0ABP1GCR3_9CHLO
MGSLTPSPKTATHRLQVNQLKERCVTRLKFSLTRDNFAETVVLADRVNHQGLQQACVNFAMQEENRSVLQNGEQKMLKRIVDDAPDLAVKLMEAFMKQGVPKEAQNG